MICNKELTKAIIDGMTDDFDLVISNIENTFDLTTVLPSETKSKTIQMLATIKDNKQLKEILKYYSDFVQKNGVFAKISFDFKGPAFDTRYGVETIIYRYLLYLIDYQRTPNIVRFIAAIKWENPFDNFTKIQNPTLPQQQLMNMMHAFLAENKDYVLYKTAYILLNEIMGGTTLHELLTKKKFTNEFTENDLLFSVFQICYTLNELYLHDVRHNDLHSRNILFEVLDKPLTLIYFTSETEYYIFTTRFVPKLFDFDLSTFVEESGEVAQFYNSTVEEDMCGEYGICSTPNSKFDIFLFAKHLVNYTKRFPKLSNVVKAVIPNDAFLNNAICCPKYPSRLCKQTSDQECDPQYIPSDNDVRNFNSIINNEINPFLQFKKSVITDGYPGALLPTLSEELPPPTVTPNKAFNNYNFVYISAMVCPDPRIFAISLLQKMKRGEIKNLSQIVKRSSKLKSTK